MAATVKHFPGHGDTGTDSHVGLPLMRHTRAQWEELDEPPFRAAVEAGADVVMTAHIVFPALDPSGDPATLSRPIVTGILRERLGFRGWWSPTPSTWPGSARSTGTTGSRCWP